MGPYCTALLGHWGANVIKVEAPGGDVLRYIGDHRGTGMGPIFLNANQGKRSLAIDLKTAEGTEVIQNLARSADIFVHNTRSVSAARRGFGPDDILAANPRIVYCAFRGFGRGGPYEDRPAYDDVIQAASGFAAVQGGKSSEPEYVRSAIADKTVGIVGASAILAALHGRNATGVGRAIEVPMFETMTSFLLLEQQGGWAFDPPVGESGYARTESSHRRPCTTLDGSLAVMIYTDTQWNKFFTAIGRPELSSDSRFRTIRERTINIDALYTIVNDAMRQRTTAEWESTLSDADIATAPVNSIPDLFVDPHLVSTDFFEHIEHPSEGPLRLPRQPVDMGVPSDHSRFAPVYGQHTAEVLSEIGFVDQDVTRMLESGVAIQSSVEHQTSDIS